MMISRFDVGTLTLMSVWFPPGDLMFCLLMYLLCSAAIITLIIVTIIIVISSSSSRLKHAGHQ